MNLFITVLQSSTLAITLWGLRSPLKDFGFSVSILYFLLQFLIHFFFLLLFIPPPLSLSYITLWLIFFLFIWHKDKYNNTSEDILCHPDWYFPMVPVFKFKYVRIRKYCFVCFFLFFCLFFFVVFCFFLIFSFYLFSIRKKYFWFYCYFYLFYFFKILD